MPVMKIELAHDILAKRIFDKISAEDKMRLKIHHLLNDRYVYYQEQKALLSKDDLDYITPFLDTVTLDAIHTDLIEKSRLAISRRQRRYSIIIAGIVVWLLIFNAFTRYSNSSSMSEMYIKESQLDALNMEDSLKTAADARADSLLKFLQTNNPEFTEQLLASYDTLKLVQESLEQERNIAQSSTLSNLAATALQQNDKDYAFQLAAKSWELNKNNKLACDVLYKVSADSMYQIEVAPIAIENDSLHNIYISRLINTQRSKGGGTLKEADLNVIFNAENRVVKKKEDGVKGIVDEWYEKAQ